MRGLLQFVGYTQPYSRIRYELDFSLGAEVDLGCGTAVVGNGAGDPIISKDVFAHPHSMHHISYQWLVGRANLKADPPDPGYFWMKCPRYHRFKVTKAGNFTFVRRTHGTKHLQCLSLLALNLSEHRPSSLRCVCCSHPTETELPQHSF